MASIAAGGGPMNTMPGVGAPAGERFVLGQETVAGMDRLCAGQFGDLEHLVAAQVGLFRRGGDRCSTPRRTPRHASHWRSASENTATVWMPMRRAVRATRQAISPRLAMRILANTAIPSPSPAAAALARKAPMPSFASGVERIWAMRFDGVFHEVRRRSADLRDGLDQVLGSLDGFGAVASSTVQRPAIISSIASIDGCEVMAGRCGRPPIPEALGRDEVAMRVARRSPDHVVRADHRRDDAQLDLDNANCTSDGRSRCRSCHDANPPPNALPAPRAIPGGQGKSR